MFRYKLILTAFLFVFLSKSFGADVPKYKIIDLGTLGGISSEAHSINNLGQVVGSTVYANGGQRAVLWEVKCDDLAISAKRLSNKVSQASSINDKGWSVGWTIHTLPQYLHYKNYDIQVATLWASDGNEKYPFGLDKSNATWINNKGQGVGFKIQGGYFPAYYFDASNSKIEVKMLYEVDKRAYQTGIPNCINDNGIIVGYTKSNTFRHKATLFDPTGGGKNRRYKAFDFLSVNNTGQVVGKIGRHNEDEKKSSPALLDLDNPDYDIDLAPQKEIYGAANCINNKKKIVGTTYRLEWNSRKETDTKVDIKATLFDPSGSGRLTFLETTISSDEKWNLHEARGINDHGWIVGSGITPDGVSHAFLLVPTDYKKK